ncbi:hypothetical protein AN219_36420 [Streptomyces nanshensis]|nr:hypothetical protein AN219_36420 [Streptomyces nanshensis]
MTIRRGMRTRSVMAAVAVTTGLVLAAGCSGDSSDDGGKSPAPSGQEEKGDDSGGSAPDEGKVLAEVKGGDDLTLRVTSAERDEGGFVTVNGELTNGSGRLWTGVEWKSDETELSLKNRASMAASKLTDKAGKKRYFILRDTEGRCLCTSFQGGLKPGETKSWYAQFPSPPENRSKVDFQIADMPPASIDISEG